MERERISVWNAVDAMAIADRSIIPTSRGGRGSRSAPAASA